MIDKPRILLVDLSSLFWAAWHVNHENGIQEARKATLAGVKRAMGDGHDTVAICCDSGKSFRKEISADYKAQREKQPEAAYGELNKTKERLAADGFLLWEAPNFEADDVIATACDKARGLGHEVRIASADKDLMQLVGPGVDVLRTHVWEVWTAATVLEKIKVKPTQLGDYLALTGDASDNIPGCPGIGKVRAAELLNKFDTIGKLYAAMDAGQTVATPANEKALKEHRAAVEMSRRLVELNYEAPINFEQIFQERKVQPLTQQNENLPPADPEDAESATEPESAASSVEPATTQAQESSGGASVALVPVVEYSRQLEPRTMRAAVWLGEHLYNSRLYTKFKTAESITAVILRGRELGLGAATALDCFHVVEGRPTPLAWFIVALAEKDPDCEYIFEVESTETSSTWETKHRRNPTAQRLVYTIEQAQKAQLVKPGSAWEKHRADMLSKTCASKLARRVYRGATLGLYSAEEMGGEE